MSSGSVGNKIISPTVPHNTLEVGCVANDLKYKWPYVKDDLLYRYPYGVGEGKAWSRHPYGLPFICLPQDDVKVIGFFESWKIFCGGRLWHPAFFEVANLRKPLICDWHHVSIPDFVWSKIRDYPEYVVNKIKMDLVVFGALDKVVEAAYFGQVGNDIYWSAHAYD